MTTYLNTTCAAPRHTLGLCFLPAQPFDRSSRGFPDVVVFGGYFGTVTDGQEDVVEGSSVAAPIMAGIVARLNELALDLTARTLGLVAPLFYAAAFQQPNIFNDLTVGNNICGQGSTSVADGCKLDPYGYELPTTCSGYSCAMGWDAVTGLGSPNVSNIR